MRKIVMVAFVMALVVVLAAVLARNGEAAGDAMKWPSEVVGWKWDGKQEAYDAQSIFKYIDGAAEVYLAYNFQGLNVGRYDRDGRPELVADVYRMGTAEDAFGAFSFERQDDDAAIGQGSEFGGGLLRFWKGSYFVTVYADGEAPDTERAVLWSSAKRSLPRSGRLDPRPTSPVPCPVKRRASLSAPSGS